MSAVQLTNYNRIISSIDTQTEYEQSVAFYEANAAYQGTKGWFFSCDDLCTRNKKRMEIEKNKLADVRAVGYAQLSDAKAQAGIFSTIGVEEVKASFWDYFNKGAKFAKRQTMWDALFTGFRSVGRNESTSEYIMKMIMQTLMNFTLGLVMCLGIFILGLYSIIKSYQPDPVTAVAFFLVAGAAAFATVSTVIMGMFAGVGTAGFAVGKIIEQQQRLEGGPGGQRRHLHQQ